MPVTKTAKRALRSSKNKEDMNKLISSELEIAIRKAKKAKSPATVRTAISFTDRASKRGIVHKNKASRMKQMLAKLAKPAPKKTTKVKSSPKKSSK